MANIFEKIAKFREDVWGREVLLGVSWDLLTVVLAATVVAILLHALALAFVRTKSRPSSDGERVLRHRVIDRAFHWAMAISVVVCLLTGVLPILGFNFPWLSVHWWAGLALLVVVIFHIVHSTFFRRLRAMWIGTRDFSTALNSGEKPGKYSLAQKSMHAAVTVLTLTVTATGLVLFAMIDTPWWERSNALSESTMGWVFFFHGASTIGLASVISLHVYFAIRPEKLFYTRSMIRGWISKSELEQNHDRARWALDDTDLD